MQAGVLESAISFLMNRSNQFCSTNFKSSCSASSEFIGEAVKPSLEKTIEITNANSGHVLLVEPNNNHVMGKVRVICSQGVPESFHELFDSFATWDTGLVPTDKGIVVNDISNHAPANGCLIHSAMEIAGIRGYQSTPIHSSSGHLLGAISTHYRKPITPQDVQPSWLNMVAQQLSFLIERLYQINNGIRKQSQLQKVIDHLQESVIKVDANGAILEINSVALVTLGYTQEEILTKKITDLFPDLKSKNEIILWPVCLGLESKESRKNNIDIQAVTKDGQIMSMLATFLPDDYDQCFYIILKPKNFFEHETPLRVQPPDEFGTMNRLSKITESQQQQSERLAAIGALAAGLGHDLNNIFLPIRAHVNAVSSFDGDGSSQAHLAHLSEINKGLDYLQDLADGLHALSSDPFKDHRDNHLIDLEKWWAQSRALLTCTLSPNISLEAHFNSDIPMVSIGNSALTQTMLNCFVNAGEAICERGPEHKGVIRLDGKLSGNGQHVCLELSDNGVGMTQETRRRALDIFYTTKNRGIGSGLGLSMVHRLMTEFGGSVGIASERGIGTTITLNLPIVARQSTALDLTVAVALTNKRSSGFIQGALLGRGIQKVVLDSPIDVPIWVIHPKQVALANAREWRVVNPQGLLFLVGKPFRTEIKDWKSLSPIQIDAAEDFEQLVTVTDEIYNRIYRR